MGEMMQASQKCLSLIIGAVIAASAIVFNTGANAATIHIVALGTSNTYGKGVARRDDYPSKLQAALRKRGYHVSVSNEGVNGDTSAGIRSRVNSSVPSGTQIVIVEPGYNDGKGGRLHGGRIIDPSETRANFDAIVSGLRSRGIQVLLIGRRGVDLASVARAHGALYYPEFRAGAWNNPADLTADGRHLNAAGYDVVVARLLPKVEALIARVGGHRH
jgi:acyl-CoA thioesterase I